MDEERNMVLRFFNKIKIYGCIIDNIREYIPILRSDKDAIEISLMIEDMIVHFIALFDLPRA